MYTRPRLTLIKSDEGYSVEVLGRTGILYAEGKKRLLVDSEFLVGPSGLAIYSDSINVWEPPFENEVIDVTKKECIVENIRRAFRYDGFEIHVL